ncbi:hypothetical protein [Bradyrhizobium murdochi]|uniref:hypothetical protein n=1 Tax=Bradyrhizobium murdochi TaxID=1038859 RepID=UPI00041EF1B6|nr:hypothetical protein [Bradyrhizobium murdochi]
MPPTRPDSDYEAFQRDILQQIAEATALSYEQLEPRLIAPAPVPTWQKWYRGVQMLIDQASDGIVSGLSRCPT